MYAITLNATGVYRIGQAGATPSGLGGWYLSFTGSGWTGSIVLAQDRNAPGSVSLPIAAASLTNVGYYNPSTGAAVNAGTAITSDGNWQVDSTVFDLYLNYTHTAGSVTVTIQPGGQLVGEPVEGLPLPAALVTRGTFGADIPDTGTYTFPTQIGFGTKVISTTALATPSAVSATTGEFFASTVSGATLMGFGTTGDVTLKNRAGTDVLVVTANTLNITAAGAVAATGALSGASASLATTITSATPSTQRLTLSEITCTPDTTFAVQSGGSLAGVRGSVVVSANKTFTDGFLYGTQGKVTLSGTMNEASAARIAGVIGQVDLASGTVTDGQVSAVWADMQATAPTLTDPSQINVLRVTNSTSSTLNAMAFFYGQSTYFLTCGRDGGDPTYFGTAAPSGLAKSLKIKVGSTDYYIPLYSAAS